MNLSNLSRRDFARLTALGAVGAAAQLSPEFAALAVEPAAPVKPVGYAIIGLGRIADHFMAGCQETLKDTAHASFASKVTGLVSGHPEKAAAIAQKYGVPKPSIYTYENMDEMRSNPAIEAVYVALPNSM